MLEQPQSPTASHTKQQVFDHYLARLQDEIHSILSCEANYEERVTLLQHELDVFKRQCFTSEKARRDLEEENYHLKVRLEGLETIIKASEQRIICLIDGDGTIFTTDLLAQGQQGGRLAARQLTEAIQDYVGPSCPRSLWVYIFYNRRGLLDTFGKSGTEFRGARDAFDDFVIGFNQSCERFLMVDVGYGKEAADAKIKALLDDHARSLQTHKLFFGGCHDNGYIHNLHSLWTSGHQDKIILLPGYSCMASEISKLPLPALSIPDLFMSEKIVVPTSRETSPARSASSVRQGSPIGPPPGLSKPLSDDFRNSPSPETSRSTPSSSPQLTDAIASLSSSISSVASSTEQRNTMSYRSVLQTSSSSQSPTILHKAVGEYTNSHAKSRLPGKSRRINPNIPLNRHDPPPCTLFYLAANGCKFGTECRYGHDYELVDDDYEILQKNAKKYPCPALNRGDMCVFGEDCCYGHTCPMGTMCRFQKLGQCHFKAASMHRDA
ncbi:hypothetical protein BD410DRAFT_779576 [Rickenella mellea]|uniref:C3H1-type domain-containing protein n=1 Tax=Rickenella mellea TaxID=50990 RepID=A0A4R5XDT3_9AGAM|nr:hypothetical protein BD410DRAFT_779576 [Rickenella mellea]